MKKMQLWRRAPESEILYLADQVGYVRKGDYVALMLVLESWRQQFQRPYKVAVDPKHPGNCFAPFFQDYLAPLDDFEDWFPPLGCIWSHADRAHRQYGITPQLGNMPPAQEHIAIVPVLDAKYDCDKNWSLATIREIIQMACLTGRKVIVVGTTPTLTPISAIFKGNAQVTFRADSIMDSAKDVLSACAVIGGDTGLTHLAAVSDREQIIISVQGCYALKRAQGTYLSWRPWLLRNFISWQDQDKARWCIPKFHSNKQAMVLLTDMAKRLTESSKEVMAECLKSITA